MCSIGYYMKSELEKLENRKRILEEELDFVNTSLNELDKEYKEHLEYLETKMGVII